MKRLLIIWISFFICAVNSFAQSGAGINYQAVARNSEGVPLRNSTLDVRFTISCDAEDEWIEEHLSKTTNDYGVFILYIGLGSRVGGNATKFADIDWSKQYTLKTDIDFGTGYRRITESELRWVPYALYALKSGNGTSTSEFLLNFNPITKILTVGEKAVDLSVLTGSGSGITDIALTGNELLLSQNGSTKTLDLSKFLDNTDSQELRRDGQTLFITGGNQVSLPIQFLTYNPLNGSLDLQREDGSVSSTVAIDSDPKNEIQQLRLNADTLEIFRSGESKSDSKVVLPDLYEERDTIYLKGYPKPRKISLRHDLVIPEPHKLSVSRGNIVTVDTDPANEIQDLTLVDNKLKITKNAQASNVNLAPYLDNTDNQNLSINTSDTTLNISNGNSVKINNLVNVPWVGFSCHNTADYGLLGNEEYTISWNEEFDDSNNLNSSNFVAPSTGVYSFAMSYIFGSVSIINIKVLKNNQIFKTFPVKAPNFANTLLVHLKANDKISIIISNGDSYTQQLLDAYFSGYRVH